MGTATTTMTVASADEELRAVWRRLGRLNAQRSLLEIVVNEQADAAAVVPRGDGEWQSASKEVYRAALLELRGGLSVVARGAEEALAAVQAALREAENAEQLALAALANAEAAVAAGVGGLGIGGNTSGGNTAGGLNPHWLIGD